MMNRLDRAKYGERGADKQGSSRSEPEDKYAAMAKKYAGKMKKEGTEELPEDIQRIIQLAHYKR
jgi:hypothetical protein